MMIVSIVFYGNNSYPGLWAFLPCFGAALYIAGNTNYTFSNRFNLIHVITNNKVLIFIGVISYSLYLWHWIILVPYLYIKEFVTVTLYLKLALLAVIFLISALSWKFIEQPVRRLPCFKNRKILWGSTVTVILSLFFISSNIRDIDYFRNVQNVIQYASAKKVDFFNYQENMPVNFIVIGDSHARSNGELFEKLAVDYHYQGKYAILTDVVNSFRQGKKGLEEIKEIEQAIAQYKMKTAFVLLRLANEYDGRNKYYNENQKTQKFVYGPNPKLPPQEAFLQSLRDTVLLLKQNGIENIYIQMPLPEPKNDIPRYAFLTRLFYRLSDQEFNMKFQESVSEYAVRCGTLNSLLQNIEKEFQEVTLIDPTSVFLNSEKNHYVAIKDTVSYYYDDDHLSIEGANLLYPVYEEFFKKIKKNSRAE